MGYIASLAGRLVGTEYLLPVCAAAVFFLVSCILCVATGRYIGRMETERQVKSARLDAVKRSRAVVAGQVNEQLAPLLPGFPCDLSEVQFIGKPVDFIGFCGSRDTGLVDENQFIEVKTGGSTLSRREQSVKQAGEQGRVRYVEYRVRTP